MRDVRVGETVKFTADYIRVCTRISGPVHEGVLGVVVELDAENGALMAILKVGDVCTKIPAINLERVSEPDEVQSARKARFEAINGGDMLVDDGNGHGFEVPDALPKYFGAEITSGEVVWGYFAETQEEIAQEFAVSETGAERYRIYDLDTGAKFAPVTPIMTFRECSVNEH